MELRYNSKTDIYENIFILFFSLSFFSSFAAKADTFWKEIRTLVFTPEKGQEAYLLQPDQGITQTVQIGQGSIPTRKFLRVVGGIQMPAPFESRGEEMFRRSEFYIDDNLDSIIRKKDRYSLYFKGDNDPFERHAIIGSVVRY